MKRLIYSLVVIVITSCSPFKSDQINNKKVYYDIIVDGNKGNSKFDLNQKVNITNSSSFFNKYPSFLDESEQTFSLNYFEYPSYGYEPEFNSNDVKNTYSLDNDKYQYVLRNIISNDFIANGYFSLINEVNNTIYKSANIDKYSKWIIKESENYYNANEFYSFILPINYNPPFCNYSWKLDINLNNKTILSTGISIKSSHKVSCGLISNPEPIINIDNQPQALNYIYFNKKYVHNYLVIYCWNNNDKEKILKPIFCSKIKPIDNDIESFNCILNMKDYSFVITTLDNIKQINSNDLINGYWIKT